MVQSMYRDCSIVYLIKGLHASFQIFFLGTLFESILGSITQTILYLLNITFLNKPVDFYSICKNNHSHFGVN
jgi:hypothetical protein